LIDTQKFRERNTTGLPWSVGRPRARRPARPSVGSVTDDERRQSPTGQTPASKTILAR